MPEASHNGRFLFEGRLDSKRCMGIEWWVGCYIYAMFATWEAGFEGIFQRRVNTNDFRIFINALKINIFQTAYRRIQAYPTSVRIPPSPPVFSSFNSGLPHAVAVEYERQVTNDGTLRRFVSLHRWRVPS